MGPYTLEKLNELKEWFDTHELPIDLQLDKSTYIPDLKDTVLALLDQAFVCYSNPKMQGGIVLLEKIKIHLDIT